MDRHSIIICKKSTAASVVFFTSKLICDWFGQRKTGRDNRVAPKTTLKKHIRVEFMIDDMDLTCAESKVAYKQIPDYVLENYGFKVSNFISHRLRKNYYGYTQTFLIGFNGRIRC